MNYSNKQYMRLLNAIIVELQLDYEHAVDQKHKKEILALAVRLKRIVIRDLIMNDEI